MYKGTLLSLKHSAVQVSQQAKSSNFEAFVAAKSHLNRTLDSANVNCQTMTGMVHEHPGQGPDCSVATLPCDRQSVVQGTDAISRGQPGMKDTDQHTAKHTKTPASIAQTTESTGASYAAGHRAA